MRTLFIGIALVTTAAAATAGAQEQTSIVTGHAPAIEVTPYAGYINFGSLNDYAGGVRQSFDNRAVLGAQAGLALTRNLSVVGNFAHAQTRPVYKNLPGSAQAQIGASDVGLWLYDANLEYRSTRSLPLGTASLRPFVQAGAGAVRYTTDDASISSQGKNYVTLNGGVGADLQVRGPIGLRVMAKDYVTSLDWDRANDVTLRDPESRRAHNLAFTAGVKIGF
jgi:hypothetical protein